VGTLTTYIALLRAINVGGTKKITMADLAGFFVALGFDQVRTIVQTGNVVFATGDASASELEAMLEREAKNRLGLDTDFFVRRAAEWEDVVAQNVFPDEAESDPGHLVVMALKETPGAADVSALQAAVQGPELVRAVGKQLYVVYPAGIGRSRLTLKLIERELGTRGTGRNWNTVLKIAEVAGWLEALLLTQHTQQRPRRGGSDAAHVRGNGLLRCCG
jgi:uncharacterized protein (DUF1697 family)